MNGDVEMAKLTNGVFLMILIVTLSTCGNSNQNSLSEPNTSISEGTSRRTETPQTAGLNFASQLSENGIVYTNVGFSDGMPLRFKLDPDFSDENRMVTFSEGLAGFRDRDTGLVGFFDKTGEVVIPAQFESCEFMFTNGVAGVKRPDNRFILYKDGMMSIVRLVEDDLDYTAEEPRESILMQPMAAIINKNLDSIAEAAPTTMYTEWDNYAIKQNQEIFDEIISLGWEALTVLNEIYAQAEGLSEKDAIRRVIVAAASLKTVSTCQHCKDVRT